MLRHWRRELEKDKRYLPARKKLKYYSV